jgi:hypothetical protein
MTQVFSCLNKILIYIYIYITNTYFIAFPWGKIKKKEAEEQWGRRPKVASMMTIPSSLPRTGAGVPHFLQVLQDELGNVLDGHHAQVDQDTGTLHDLPR